MENSVAGSKRRGIGTLIAGAAMAGTLAATLGSGVSYAASEAPLGVPASTVSADGKFFTPGPNTVVKRNAVPADARTMSVESASPVTPGPAGTADYYTIKNAHWIAQSCGTELIQQTSGQGKTTLVLSVDKSIAATVTKEINVDLKYISAGMGWSVTSSYGVKNETRYEVPEGKWGTVQAFPLYDVFEGDAHAGVGGGLPTGKRVWAYKPVGVCFNQWTS